MRPVNNDMEGNRLLNVGTPSGDHDAATKAYVDGHGSGVANPMTSDLDAGAHDVNNVGVVRTNVVQHNGVGQLVIGEAIADGNIDMDGGRIPNLADEPTNQHDAVNVHHLSRGGPLASRPTTGLRELVGRHWVAWDHGLQLSFLSDDSDDDYVWKDLVETPFAQDVDAGGHRLGNLAAPGAANDAATKSYVDGVAVPPPVFSVFTVTAIGGGVSVHIEVQRGGAPLANALVSMRMHAGGGISVANFATGTELLRMQDGTDSPSYAVRANGSGVVEVWCTGATPVRVFAEATMPGAAGGGHCGDFVVGP